MRVCFVTNRPAWPLNPGFKLRAGMVLQALAECADVDVVMALPDRYDDVPVPPGIDLSKVTVHDIPKRSTVDSLRTWARSDLPMSMVKVDWGHAAGKVAEQVGAGSYDVVWVLAGTAWTVVDRGALRRAGTRLVLDLDDLEDQKIRHRIASTSGWPRSVSEAFLRLQDRIDLPRWEQLHREVYARADAVTVCSELDVRRVSDASPGVKVLAVPNGYRDPQRLQTEDDLSPVPTLLFVGDLGYRPNEEAAAFLCEQVLPLVRAEVSDVRVRIVGKNPGGQAWATLPGVEVLGRVDSIDDEILGASVSVAPLLSGGGTRIKIIEAMAFGVPVVATTVGAEGLNSIDGRHLLIADDPASFARSCLQLIADADLRRRLRAAGRALYEADYTPTAVRSSVQRVLDSVMVEK